MPAFQYSRATNTRPTRCPTAFASRARFPGPLSCLMKSDRGDIWPRTGTPVATPSVAASSTIVVEANEDTPPIDQLRNGHIQLNSFGVSFSTLTRKLTVAKELLVDVHDVERAIGQQRSFVWCSKRDDASQRPPFAPLARDNASVAVPHGNRRRRESSATGLKGPPLVLVPVAPLQICGVRRDSKLLFKSRGGIAPGVRAACQAMNEHRRHILRSGCACVRGTDRRDRDAQNQPADRRRADHRTPPVTTV